MLAWYRNWEVRSSTTVILNILGGQLKNNKWQLKPYSKVPTYLSSYSETARTVKKRRISGQLLRYGTPSECFILQCSAIDTIKGKQAFEKFAHARGVRVEHYHANNGIFASNGFKDEVKKCGQSITFCGVGAHHQNGVTERRIQDLSDSAQSMLAHAAHRNPAVTANLWPYALLHASYVRRMLPRENQAKSPDELFSKTDVRPTTRFLHVFGAPVYVLHSDLQGGKSIPKWNQRSRVCIYLGNSRMHASSMSLILNPKTGYVSPQFHCIYDD
jgi:hypothetical protein